jgi:hypothetical protein
LPAYSESLARFFDQYGPIRRLFTKVSLYLNITTNKHDDRPFAYVVIVWQDKQHSFHLFRERWVKDDDLWYTRVVGLIAHDRDRSSGGADGVRA